MTETLRNSSAMVDMGLEREIPALFHFDGEFASAEELVVETLLGRNMGWLAHERATALTHIARVIREDEGINPRRTRTLSGRSLPYRELLAAQPSVPESLRIPVEYRLDVSAATDLAVVHAIAKLMHAYMDSIRFGAHDTFRRTLSPYDLFLSKNHLPATPNHGERQLEYARRLLNIIRDRERFTWVTSLDDQFRLHDQTYAFGERELAGLKIFFAEAVSSSDSHRGNCVACHPPPQFTDHRLHNTGVSQLEYDALFGAGAFSRLRIPRLAERNANYDEYLPASLIHPKARNRFRSTPSSQRPGFTDLGAWNILGNPDFPKPQDAITQVLCTESKSRHANCPPDVLLDLSIAAFKTPSIRDPGHSDPYFHSGAEATLDGVVRFYMRTSELARNGKLRNGAPAMQDIHLNEAAVPFVSAFLRSLNEDYH